VHAHLAKVEAKEATMRDSSRTIGWVVRLSLLAFGVMPGVSQAKTAREIDASVSAARGRFVKQVKGADAFLRAAKAVLVFPGVVQAGLGVGGEYGEGALRIGGKTAGYYSIASGSIGLQLGAQKKDIILVFLQEAPLRSLQEKDTWQVGVDGSVVLANLGAEASIDSTKYNQPVVGFVVGQKGLMYNLTLEGSKISKLQR
jgi:lipid-binding SYLF domain-containing protein